MASTIEKSEGCRIATMTMASAKAGMVWKNSVKRISASSISPPKYPASAPDRNSDGQRRQGRDQPDDQRDAGPRA